MAFAHQRLEAAGALDIAAVVGARADRRRRRRAQRVALLGAAQRAAGQHADVDDAIPAGLGRARRFAVFLGGEPGGAGGPGAGVKGFVLAWPVTKGRGFGTRFWLRGPP